MSEPLISVVVPTIDGREKWLEKCVSSYEEFTEDWELIVLRGYKGAGAAWSEGFRRARGDFIHVTADDIECEEGWWRDPVHYCVSGRYPAPLIFHSDGSLQSCGGSWEGLEPDGAVTVFSRVPFLRREWAAWVPEMPDGFHYYTDNLLTDVFRLHGVETVNCHSYRLVHHSAPEGRIETQEQYSRDYPVYVELLGGVTV